MRNKILSLILLIMIAALAITGCATPQAQAAPVAQPANDTPRTLSINGHGEVTLTPDIAYIYVGVHTELENAADAVAENNDNAQAVIDALKATGIKAEDISTTNFSLYLSQQYDQNGQPTGNQYIVDNTVNITVRDLAKLGDLLGTAIDAGANSVNGISFDVSDKEAALKEARAKAVTDARTQAEELAGLAEVELGDVLSISMYGGTPTPYYGGNVRVESESSVGSVPITPGQFVITVDVSILFGLK